MNSNDNELFSLEDRVQYRPSSKLSWLRNNVDALIAWGMLNAGALKGADVLMDETAKLPDYLDGAVTLGEGILLLPALYYGNKKIINPIVRKIKGTEHQADGSMAESVLKWAKTGAFGVIAYIATFPNVGSVLGINDVPGMNMNDVVAKHYKKGGVIVQKTGDVAQSVLELLKSFRNPEQTSTYEQSAPNNKVTSLEQEIISENLKIRENTYKTGELKGTIVPPFISQIYGIPSGKLAEHVSFDPKENAKRQWEKKLRASKNNSTMLKYRNTVVNEYLQSEPELMTLQQYITQVDKELESIKENFDWNKYATTKGLDTNELALIKKIAQQMGGRELLAYSMTEIMPYVQGEKNAQWYDFILRTQGRKAVNIIAPSISDEIGVGEYQMTQSTLGEVVKNMNEYLPNEIKVPTNLWELEEEHHPQAAYLLAIENLSILVNGRTAQEKKIIENKWDYDRNSIVQSLSAYHNNPQHAKTASNIWLKSAAKKEFVTCCSPKIKNYVMKTQTNYSALS